MGKSLIWSTVPLSPNRMREGFLFVLGLHQYFVQWFPEQHATLKGVLLLLWNVCLPATVLATVYVLQPLLLQRP